MPPTWPAVRHTLIRLVLILLATTMLLAACGRDEPADPTPSETVPSATATAPVPSPTPSPAPTDTPTVEPLTTLDLSALIAANEAAEGNSPFTGLPIDDPDVLNRMPIAVKISNSPIARPQSGLSKADIVVEHLAEGGITRFTAIYHSQDAEGIGSVRSARLIDLETPVLFDAFLVYSGASGDVENLIANADFGAFTLSDQREDPGFYRLKIPGRTYEHTLFTDTALLWQEAEQRGWAGPPRSLGWAWSEKAPRTGSPALAVEIPYSSEYSDVRYEYDPASGTYQRFILGEPHIDELTGEQLTTPNVVVLTANHVPTLIVEDILGSKSVQIQLWGQGRLQLFRDGVMQEGVWVRPHREDPVLFLDDEMRLLPLKPGPVWIEIVPPEMEVTVP